MSLPIHPDNLDLADREWYLDELYMDWRAASAAADAAYADWKPWPDRDRYAAYVAATDQADAAADHLATAQRLHRATDGQSGRQRLFART